MSLSDYVKRLRALRGGVTPIEIEAATGVPAPAISLIERKYRRIGDDEVLARLAAYFQVSVEELESHRQKYRKLLTAFLIARADSGAAVRLTLNGGEELVGIVLWSDRTAIGLRPRDGQEDIVVYRHAVDDWGDA